MQSRSTSVNNVALEYKVFFLGNFDWVKGGKLPGLYGGHTTRCSSGNPALDFLSTRLMWRAGGVSELYLYYAQKDRPTPSLCMTPSQLRQCVIRPMDSLLLEDLSHSQGERGHM
ncbi:hypothetical protein F5888DRAFT_362930 [Russula emetica]|nr:hypothetical protein F5888DRAFT_362930 [Russula emetica]